MLFFNIYLPKATVTVQYCKIFRTEKGGCSLVKPRQGLGVEFSYRVQGAKVYSKSEFWLSVLRFFRI